MGLKYRYILGGIIFAYVKGIPDISYAVAEVLNFQAMNKSVIMCQSRGWSGI